MNRIFYLLFLLVSSGILISKNDKVYEEKNDWKIFFTQVNLDGTFLLTKLNSDTLFYYNQDRMNKKFLSASTFKIPNSLISLETEAIKDENEIIKWDGRKRFYDKWNQDQNLKSAIKYSCVWFYQELARRIGREKMQAFVDLMDYGNRKLGEKIDTFWLEGDLRISAAEQVEFLTKFLNRELPFKKLNMDIVEKILLVDSSSTYQLYAKTGWTARVENEVGWYVGFVKKESEYYIFALNIDIIESKDAVNRENITRKILKKEGLID